MAIEVKMRKESPPKMASPFEINLVKTSRSRMQN
jgi:hypothetical protein